MRGWCCLYLSAALLAPGCMTKAETPQLGSIYDRTAMHHDAERNPVIVIPGILGSKLKDLESGKSVWGAFGGNFANPSKADGAQLVALPMTEELPITELRDAVVADGALDRLNVNFFFVPVRLKAYLQILSALGVGGFRDQQLGDAGAVRYGKYHFTCFQFSYDWRQDMAVNAARLHQFIIEKKAYVEHELDRRFGIKRDVKFNIVAHSMGGLLTRYYLRYGEADLSDREAKPLPTWAGADYVDRVVLIGTPSAGSINSFTTLINGIKFAPMLPKFEPALLGTMPSIYQLLPRPRHKAVVSKDNFDKAIDLYDPEVWIRMKWGLADPKQDRVLKKLLPGVEDKEARRRIALDHLRKSLARAQRMHRALDTPSVPPEGLSLHLFAGDSVLTPSVGVVDENSGKFRLTRSAPGDGTVLRSSALMDERVGRDWTPLLVSPIHWSQVVFLFQDHIGLTKDPVFIDNILFFLLEKNTF